MSEAADLIADAGHHGLGGVAYPDHCDAGAEIDQGIVVSIDEDAAACLLNEHRQRHRDAAGDSGVPSGEQGPRPGTGDRCDEPTLLGEFGSAIHAPTLGPAETAVTAALVVTGTTPHTGWYSRNRTA